MRLIAASNNPMDIINVRKCFVSKETHPLTLDALMKELIPQWLTWEPEVIWLTIRNISRKEPNFYTKSKINAMKFLHNSEAAWVSWEDFSHVCDALNNSPPDFDILNKPELGEVANALEIMKRVRAYPFADEIKKFVAAVCLDHGILFAPPPLSIAQSLLDVVEYRCTRCGNVDILDNGVCDTCRAPDSALVKVPRYFDWSEVATKWESIKGKPLDQIELDENMVDIHLYKLIEALATVEESMQQYSQEIKSCRLQ